jgi:predicted unusual protein kinase regulating ubiquinone biosynthesis (AarF/ABC1/UbiB family)
MSITGRLQRYAQLGALAGRVGATLVTRRSADGTGEDPGLRQRAEDLARTLGRMRGAAMKMGQTLAIAADHLDLAPELRTALGALHAQGDPVPFEQIRATVEAQLGAPLDALFAAFDPSPLGTASLAQAHAATLHDGRPVVVKVLHDGVEEAVEADLSMLGALPAALRAAGRPALQLEPILKELRAHLHEELDYAREAENIDAFVALYGDDPRVRIPRVVRERSSARVLTLDHLPGRPVDVFVAVASKEARARAAHTLGELFFEQTFRHRLLHADPHPGNFLFEADGRVGLLDFGCVKRFSAASVGAYARIVRGSLDGDRLGALRGVQAFGAWEGALDDDAADTLWTFCQAAVAPWRDGVYEVSEATPSLVRTLGGPAEALARHTEIVPPPDVVMLHRTVAGVYALGRRLGATAAWGSVAAPHLAAAIAAAPLPTDAADAADAARTTPAARATAPRTPTAPA